jgi:predicted transcriptional regulator of viral defense system
MERMSFFSFQESFGDRDIINVNDILKIYPNFDTRRLVEWQEKGYIQKVTNKNYTWSKKPVSEGRLFFTSNRLVTNSYVSLYTALRWYGFVPEGVYQVLAITTSKPQNYETPLGNFYYQHVKPPLFFGYKPEQWQGKSFLIAEPEKAFLDTAYLNPQWKNEQDLEGLRFNITSIRDICDTEILQIYAQVFNNKRLDKLTSILIDKITND